MFFAWRLQDARLILLLLIAKQIFTLFIEFHLLDVFLGYVKAQATFANSYRLPLYH